MDRFMFHAWFFGSVLLSFSICYFIRRRIARHPELKRAGGLAVAFSVLIIMAITYFLGNTFGILAKDFISILVAQSIIIIGGAIDDRYNIKPAWQLAFQSAAAIVLLLAKDTIDHIQLPVIGLVYFSGWVNYILSFLWILIVVNAFNWFDGLDGLAGGVGIIGMIVLFLLSLTPVVSQPQTAILAVISAGALLGFLYYNFAPARLHLGSIGSGFIGLMLATLSIYLGGKVATAMLILGIPLLDFAYVAIARIGRGAYPWQGGDREHIHYKLIDRGWGNFRIVFLMYFISATFGLLALTLQTGIKVLAGVVLLVVFLLFSLSLRSKEGALRH